MKMGTAREGICIITIIMIFIVKRKKRAFVVVLENDYGGRLI